MGIWSCLQRSSDRPIDIILWSTETSGYCKNHYLNFLHLNRNGRYFLRISKWNVEVELMKTVSTNTSSHSWMTEDSLVKRWLLTATKTRWSKNSSGKTLSSSISTYTKMKHNRFPHIPSRVVEAMEHLTWCLIRCLVSLLLSRRV